MHSSVKCLKKVDLNQCLNRGEWIICLCLESDERDWRETEREKERETERHRERDTETEKGTERALPGGSDKIYFQFFDLKMHVPLI